MAGEDVWFEYAAVQLIGPRPRGQRHLPSRGVAVLGGVVVADDTEFLERIQRKTGHLGWTSQPNHVAYAAAIEREILVAGAPPATEKIG